MYSRARIEKVARLHKEAFDLNVLSSLFQALFDNADLAKMALLAATTCLRHPKTRTKITSVVTRVIKLSKKIDLKKTDILKKLKEFFKPAKKVIELRKSKGLIDLKKKDTDEATALDFLNALEDFLSRVEQFVTQISPN